MSGRAFPTLRRAMKNPSKLAVTLTTALLAADLSAMDREQTKKELAKLEPVNESEPAMSARCYEIAAPPERIEYCCPVCAERTFHPFGSCVVDADELATCRRLMQELPARVLVSLDESAFCRKCRPDVATRELVLVARYQDGESESTAGVRSADLELLKAIVAGRIAVDAPEVKASLLGNLTRLKELVTLGAPKK